MDSWLRVFYDDNETVMVHIDELDAMEMGMRHQRPMRVRGPTGMVMVIDCRRVAQVSVESAVQTHEFNEWAKRINGLLPQGANPNKEPWEQ